MHTAAKVAIGLGILIIIVGIIMVTTGDSFEENAEEGIIYEGADGSIDLDNVEPNTGSKYIVHLIDVKYNIYFYYSTKNYCPSYNKFIYWPSNNTFFICSSYPIHI